MKTFQNRAAQGDVYIMRINALPPGTVRAKPKAGKFEVAHSETGHSHVMDADGRAEMYELPDSILKCFLVVKESTVLEHLRSFDTHESIMFEPGIFEIRRQREYVPEGWRRAQD